MGHLRELTSDQRADCFVFDDSLYSRTGYKKIELVAKVFDHVSMTYKKGFRMMTMGWTDGSSFVSIVSSLLSSKKEENVIGTTKKVDKRTSAAKRRIMAQSKGTDVVIQLLDQVLKAVLTAKYVMFDSWFSNPHQTCKSFLKLGTEYHGLSYDAPTAHTAFVFLRYMFMSVSKRDDRTIGELADITFHHSL
uniref:transposase n=1 Tax=Lactobacillus porci TaxID=2012477 RepID=UPI003898FCEB